MAPFPPSFSLLLLPLFLQVQPKPLPTSPYLSPARALFPDYQNMISTLKIYSYPPPQPFTFTGTVSLFHSSLLNSHFLTQDPEQAHLFLVPFPSDTTTRALSRFVRQLRTNFPYWNRTLGADHFYISSAGIPYSSSRNSLELKKNAVQVSPFPVTSGIFIPHKDVSLPPNPSPLTLPHAPTNRTTLLLAFINPDGKSELVDDPDILIASGPSDLGQSKFCLFFYGRDVSWVCQALRTGCVPVVIADRPIQDLPLMDVVKWSEIAVFVGAGGGVAELKRRLTGIGEERYELMRRLGMMASQHFVWNASPQPLDAFHTVMYQLWLRRHATRYVRR